ncbi:MAG: membrane-like protein [Sphingobium sp.]|nr:membrane-like protein [Sphingobium sp.]
MRACRPAAAAGIALLLSLAACAKYDAKADNAAHDAAAPAAMLAPGEPVPIANSVPAPPAPDVADRTPSSDTAPRRSGSLAPARDVAYRALGTEPFWSVTVRGGVATLTRPDRPPIALPVERNDDRRAVRYSGEGLTMTLIPGPCSDGMSDALYADRVQIAFAEGTLKGCGGAREEDGGDIRD